MTSFATTPTAHYFPNQDEVAYFALIPAAGVGARMGDSTPKQYLNLAGKSVLQLTVDRFLACAQISHTFVLVSPEDAYVQDALHAAPNLTVLHCGGATRRETVSNGLAYLASLPNAKNQDWVLVHDAARPGISSDLLAHLIQTLKTDPVGGLLALPVVDTVKRVHQGRLETISREGLWLAQTPQMFRLGRLSEALESALANALEVTDEASAIELLGDVPTLVEGHASNRKLTLPEDLIYFDNLFKPRNSK